MVPCLCTHTCLCLSISHNKAGLLSPAYTSAPLKISLISIHLLHFLLRDQISLKCIRDFLVACHPTGLWAALQINGGNELLPSFLCSCMKPCTGGLGVIWGPWVWLPYKWELITTQHHRSLRCTGCKEKRNLVHNEDVPCLVVCINTVEMSRFDKGLRDTLPISIRLFRQCQYK